MPPSVLLAEDDADSRELLTDALQEAGYDVTPVADGGRLLVLLAHGVVSTPAYPIFDLLIFDIHMPICTGLQILEQLRKVQWATPAILMSGFWSAGTRAQGMALGGTLLDKPFTLDTLRATARQLTSPEAV